MTSIARSCGAVSAEVIGACTPKPALFTSMSTGRAGSSSRAATRSTSALSDRSAGSTSTARPRDSSSAAIRPSRSLSRATRTRSHPRSARARANAAPIPDVAPVTSATRVRLSTVSYAMCATSELPARLHFVGWRAGPRRRSRHRPSEPPGQQPTSAWELEDPQDFQVRRPTSRPRRIATVVQQQMTESSRMTHLSFLGSWR